MSVNKELLEMGLKGEKAILEYFQSYGLDVHQNKVNANDKYEIVQNLKLGDIVIEHPALDMNFDVKMGHFVSASSMRSFNGLFYIFIPGADIENIGKNAKVVKSSTVKSYWAKVPEKFMHVGASGQTGYRFTKLKNYLLLEDFMTEYMKRIILMNNKYDDERKYSSNNPFKDLMKSFNKVYPEGVEPK